MLAKPLSFTQHQLRSSEAPFGLDLHLGLVIGCLAQFQQRILKSSITLVISDYLDLLSARILLRWFRKNPPTCGVPSW